MIFIAVVMFSQQLVTVPSASVAVRYNIIMVITGRACCIKAVHIYYANPDLSN